MKQGSLWFFLVLGLGVFAGLSTLQAQQDPNYILSVTNGSGVQNSSVDLMVMLDNNGSDMSGWSFGVCHDTAALTLNGTPVDGSTSATVNGGGAPGFDSINAFPDGFTVGFVVDLFGVNVLPAGTVGAELNVATYDLIGAEGTSTDVCFCDTLGSPPVATVVVVGGNSITPTQNCGTVDITVPPPLVFHYAAGSSTVNYPGATGVASFTDDLTIEEDSSNDGYPHDTQGFSMDIGYDDAVLTATSLDAAMVLSDLNAGSGPGFLQVNLAPVGGAGATAGVVYSLLGGVFVQYTSPMAVLTFSFDTVASALAGNSGDTLTDLTWTNDLGSPTVSNVVVVDGNSIAPDFTNGTITLHPVFDLAFIRGDCNDDGIVNLADGIWILNQLFQSGPEGGCAEACDVNSDGMLDQTDAIFVFNQQFLGGPSPAAPFPDCGTVAGAPCDAFDSCP